MAIPAGGQINPIKREIRVDIACGYSVRWLGWGPISARRDYAALANSATFSRIADATESAEGRMWGSWLL
jgi:hypothetical protein